MQYRIKIKKEQYKGLERGTVPAAAEVVVVGAGGMFPKSTTKILSW